MSHQVLLLAINGRYSHSNLALHYFQQVFRAEGIPCRLVELTIKDRLESLLKVILLDHPQRPSHLVLSVYIWNSSLMKALVADLQRIAPEIKIILGGPEVSYQADEWLQLCPQGYIVQGPGENILASLVKGELQPGIHRGPFSSMDELPFPYTEEDLQALKGRLIYYESSRGCPFRCSYCLSSCEDQPLHYRDLEMVFQDLKTLAFSSAKIVKMVDRTFNSRPGRARKIWQYLLELKGPVPFHFEIHPQFLKEEDFRILADVPSWMFHFEIGVQSSSPEELEAVNRSGDWQTIRRNIERLQQETSIPLHLDQIVGLPGADYASVRRSFNDILSLGPEEFQMGFLKLIPGTPLAEGLGKQMVASVEPPYRVWQTPELSFQEFQELQRVEEFLNAYYNSGLFLHSMEFLLGESSLYGNRPFDLFADLKNAMEYQGRVKNLQWAKLAETLWNSLKQIHPDAADLLLDKLRMDWAPLSQGQYLPGFLNFADTKRIKELRRDLWPILSGKGLTSSEFKRGILLLLDDGKRIVFSFSIAGNRSSYSFNSLLEEF